MRLPRGRINKMLGKSNSVQAAAGIAAGWDERPKEFILGAPCGTGISGVLELGQGRGPLARQRHTGDGGGTAGDLTSPTTKAAAAAWSARVLGGLWQGMRQVPHLHAQCAGIQSLSRATMFLQGLKDKNITVFAASGDDGSRDMGMVRTYARGCTVSGSIIYICAVVRVLTCAHHAVCVPKEQLPLHHLRDDSGVPGQ